MLIVEDRDIVRTLTRTVLEEAGFTVEVASNGEEAMAVASAAGPFDLLLTDVVMPGP